MLPRVIRLNDKTDTGEKELTTHPEASEFGCRCQADLHITISQAGRLKQSNFRFEGLVEVGVESQLTQSERPSMAGAYRSERKTCRKTDNFFHGSVAFTFLWSGFNAAPFTIPWRTSCRDRASRVTLKML